MVRFSILALALAGSLLFNSSYFANLLVVIGLHTLPALGLALLMGYTGQISLGHAAFYGLGAYGAALLGRHFGLNPWLDIVLAAMIVAFDRALDRWTGVPSERSPSRHGDVGLRHHRPHRPGRAARSDRRSERSDRNRAAQPLRPQARERFRRLSRLCWGACLATMALAQNLVSSPLGLSMRAIAENENVAASIGNDVGAHQARHHDAERVHGRARRRALCALHRLSQPRTFRRRLLDPTAC